jgi:hypothetical protein
MSRKKYVLKTEEIDNLVDGVLRLGADDTYDKMREKAFLSIEKMKDLDEMFLDMYEDFLERARIESEENQTTREIYYLLSSMLKILAYEINYIYRKSGKKKGGERFLKVITNDIPVPTYTPKKRK